METTNDGAVVLRRHEAIAYAESHGLLLNRYQYSRYVHARNADGSLRRDTDEVVIIDPPVEHGISVAAARELDPGLIFLVVPGDELNASEVDSLSE